jgi:hypothetical protein
VQPTTMAANTEGRIIGLYLVTQPDALRLKPQHCVYLVPDRALCIAEDDGLDHMLLMLRFGRSKEEIELFVQHLMNAFPLLLRKHVLYHAKSERDALRRVEQYFKSVSKVCTWSLGNMLAEFRSVQACMAFLRAQVG